MNNPVWENIVSGSGEGGQADNRIEQLTRARLDRERIRMKNFKLEMEEMMRRVENQPTLFQKQSQVERDCTTTLLLLFLGRCWWRLVSKTNLINCF